MTLLTENTKGTDKNTFPSPHLYNLMFNRNVSQVTKGKAALLYLALYLSIHHFLVYLSIYLSPVGYCIASKAGSF